MAETIDAIEEYGPFGVEDVDLLDTLGSSSEAIQRLVPECMGLSVACVAHGVLFTLLATSAQIAALDGFQYLDGGPGVTAVEARKVVDLELDSLDQHQWQLFAQASCTYSIASTLTLPVMVEGAVSGSINLYASTPHAFGNHHEAIAEVFDAWAPGAVANSDLTFSAREQVEAAPRTLPRDIRLQVAVGILTEIRHLDVEVALHELRDVAVRAGISDAAMAEAIIGSRSMTRIEPDVT